MSFLQEMQALAEANRPEPLRASLAEQTRWGEEFFQDEKRRSKRAADWMYAIQSAANRGEREQGLYVGVIGNPYTPPALKFCEQFLTALGFSYELATVFHRTDSRGEYLVERYVLVTW